MISFCFLLSQLFECAMLEYSLENPMSRDGKVAPIFNHKVHRQITQAFFCGKFVLFFAFVLVQTFEIEVLCLFMMSQKFARVETLELIKSKYNRYEKTLWRFTKMRIWLAALCQLYIVVIIFTATTDFYYVAMVQSGFYLLVLVFTVQEYLWASMTRQCLIYKHHKFEYARHRLKMTSLQCVILFTLVYAVIGFYVVATVSTCIRSERSYLE